MVDEHLLGHELGLRVLYLDFNSFFASVEQQERPELRDCPVAVAPGATDGTTVIAASAEAKAFGVRCGVKAGEARRMCPGLIIVPATPKLYKAYHEALREVARRVLPEERVYSIDEMSYRLLGAEREPARARQLALAMKAELRRAIGPYVRASIGIAANTFLAKTATELEKRDGLVVLETEALPGPLLKLRLTDFCGINTQMKRRLNAAMIFEADDLFRASAQELRTAFGSVTGERWWWLLRGHELPAADPPRRSLGHSYVLPPVLRSEEGVREVLLRLVQKAGARLRAEGLWAGAMSVSVSGRPKSWAAELRLPPTQDTLVFNERLLQAWERRDFTRPIKAGVTFHRLAAPEAVTPSLFEPPSDRASLDAAVDGVNGRFGKNSVHLAGLSRAKDAASEKIAFGKTWLFAEGRGDNDWTARYRDLLGEPGSTSGYVPGA